MNSNQILQNASALAINGMAVFPIVYGKKIPATKDGFYSATTDLEDIKNLFANDNFNIGIRTGVESGVIVIDDDTSVVSGNLVE